MKTSMNGHAMRIAVAAAVAAGVALDARADVITDWNSKTAEFIAESKLGTPPAIRVMALVQTAAYGAVSSIVASDAGAARNASIDAAVAAAHRVTLTKMLPAQQAAIDGAVQAALARVPDSPAKAAGIEAGERAAAAVLAERAKDSVAAADVYRPHTSAGTYVPTAVPAAQSWTQRTPWHMSGPAQFRAAPPPALSSDTWTRDFNEVKELGAKGSTKRSAEQTDIARFWEFSLPNIYFGAARSVADQRGRDIVRNARLFAAVAQAMDDAMIGVFDAKYAYSFWRPATAIRNGDIDGNDATQRDAGWASLIDSPMHPEYPSAHSTLAAAVGTVLKADVGGNRMELATSSPTAKGATRRWSNADEFIREVAESRVYAGIHYRSSIESGMQMGQRIGELAVSRLLKHEAARSAQHATDIGPRIEAISQLTCDARGVAFRRCEP